MKYIIIEDHKSDNPDPIIIKKGSRLKVDKKKVSTSEEWPNWIYCYSVDDNSEGWTPEQIIQIDGEYGIVLEDYSAKELDAKKDEVVKGIRELNGWVWCSKIDYSEEGWLPKEKIAIDSN